MYLRFLSQTPILLLFVMSSGCMTSYYTASYDIGMTEVERPVDFSSRYGNPAISKADSAGVSRYVYEDSLLSIAWLPLPSQFSFMLENKSKHSMKIIWDEAAFVSPSGQSMRVMHSGVKYIDRNNHQPPTIVVRGGSVSDIVIPTDNVFYISGQYGGWRQAGIFEPYSELSLDKLEPAKQNIGKKVQVLLPVEIQGSVNEYIFTFEVNNVELPKSNERI